MLLLLLLLSPTLFMFFTDLLLCPFNYEAAQKVALCLRSFVRSFVFSVCPCVRVATFLCPLPLRLSLCIH